MVKLNITLQDFVDELIEEGKIELKKGEKSSLTSISKGSLNPFVQPSRKKCNGFPPLVKRTL